MKRHLCVLLLALIAILSAACSRDPKVRAQRYLENGNKYFALEKFKEASIMYRRALQQDRKFGEAYYRLGLTSLKLSSYGDAAKMLRYAAELQPENSDAATKLADLYILAASEDPQGSKQLVDEATLLADRLVAQNPNSFDGHRIYAQIAALKVDPKTAIKEFQIADRQRPFQPDVVLGYFNALLADNRPAEGERIALALLDKEKTYSPIYDLLYYLYARQNRIPDAERLLQRKVENNPKNAGYLLQLAGHYYISRKRPEMDAVMAKLTDEKQFPGGHVLAGDFYMFRLREFDNAERAYEGGMAAVPADKAAYQKRLVELYAVTGKSNEANQLLATVLKENPKDGDAISMRAALMLMTGNRDQVSMAANDLQGLVAKTPSNYMLRFNYARALIAKGQLDQARLQLEEAIKLRSDLVAARELLTQLDLAKGDAPKALEDADATLKMDRNNLSAHLMRSSALLVMGERDKAHEELDIIGKLNPQNAEAAYQAGYLAWEEHDFKKAERVFGEMHKANPKDLRGLMGVVETQASQGRLDDAIQEIDNALRAEPDRQDLKLARANLLVRKQRYDEAIAVFREALGKEPSSGELLFKVAETYRLKGDLNQAMDFFRRASQAAPNDPLPLLQLSLVMEGIGKSEQAKPLYEQILKIQPDQPTALNNLAYIKAQEGSDLDGALRMAQQARQKSPETAAFADTLGWVYIKKNLGADAVRLFTDLVKKEPNNPTFHYHYGVALLQMGDKPSAKRQLEMAMKNNPSSDDKNKIQDLLLKN